jgi:hypothetical protein
VVPRIDKKLNRKRNERETQRRYARDRRVFDRPSILRLDADDARKPALDVDLRLLARVGELPTRTAHRVDAVKEDASDQFRFCISVRGWRATALGRSSWYLYGVVLRSSSRCEWA